MLPFNVREAVEFSPGKRVRKATFKEESLRMEMLYYLPGQAVHLHYHPKGNEVFCIVEGEAVMAVNEEEKRFFPKDVVLVPANSKHSISNPGPGNLVAVLPLEAPAILVYFKRF